VPIAGRGKETSEATWGFAEVLGGAPYPLSDFHHDRHFAVFHFRTAADAETLHARFGGELLSIEPRWRLPGDGT
jgi:hypothetical protein